MNYDLADLVPLSVQTQDANHQPADAGTITLTIVLPDGTSVNPAIQHIDAGQYRVDYQPTMPGLHRVSWVATGTNTSGYTDAFNIDEQIPSYIIGLQEARAALRLTSTTDDEELRSVMETAAAIIERHRNEVVIPRIVTEDYRVGNPMAAGHECSGGVSSSYPSWYYRDTATYASGVTLSQRPVISLISVVSLDGNRTWNVADLHMDLDTGLITPLPTTPTLWGQLTITYKAGYQVIPAAFQLAAKIIIQYLWATRRGGAAQARRTTARQGDIRWNIEDAGPGLEAALELLGPPIPAIA